MTADIPARVLIAAVVVFLAVLTADVALILTDHVGEAATMIVAIPPLIGMLLGQAKQHAATVEVADKVDHVLNGGTRAMIRSEIGAALARQAAADQTRRDRAAGGGGGGGGGTGGGGGGGGGIV